MTVSRNTTKIFAKKRQLYASGTSVLKPEESDIEEMFRGDNFDAYNIRVWFDVNIWRWSCDLTDMEI